MCLSRLGLMVICCLTLSAGQLLAQDNTTKEADTTAPVSAAETPDIKPRNVRIGAWNIEWLGQPDKRYGDAAGKSQTAEDLADYIIAARIEALALEEICPTNLDNPYQYDPATDGPLDNQVLRDALKIVSQKTNSEWAFRLFPGSNSVKAEQQLTGIAWDTKSLTVIGESWPVIKRTDDSVRIHWLRQPWATAFSTGEGMTDLVIIPIHMKAFPDQAPTRDLEAGQLVEALAQSAGDPDILIIGDSNCHTGDEPALATLKKAGFIDANTRNLPTHYSEAPLDRAFSPADQPEFSKRSFQVFDKPYMARRRLDVATFHPRFSDHYMIITQVQAGKDDD